MIFKDYYLRFTTEAAAMTLLEEAGLIQSHQAELDEEGNILSPAGHHPTEGVTIHYVGTIREGGEWDEEGNVVVEPTVIDGWHVNLRLREPLTPEQEAALDGLILDPVPTSPAVVFG